MQTPNLPGRDSLPFREFEQAHRAVKRARDDYERAIRREDEALAALLKLGYVVTHAEPHDPEEVPATIPLMPLDSEQG